ncbi:MAG: chromosome partitioning protein ParA, partial [Gammaproteobacteria bacterium]
MFDNPYGIINPSELFNSIATQGNATLLKLRNNSTIPYERKSPRMWGCSEAAKLIGISIPTLRKYLDANPDIEGVFREEKKGGKNGNGIKLTLTAINYFRELANTRYKRPVGSKPFVIAV